MSIDEFGGEIAMAHMPSEVYDIAARYAMKLGKALYYLHRKEIVSKSQVVDAIVYSNAEVMADSFRAEEFEALTSRPVISRSGHSLEDQFSHRFAAGIEGDSMAFLARFGESMAIAIFVVSAADLREVEIAERTSALPPVRRRGGSIRRIVAASPLPGVAHRVIR